MDTLVVILFLLLLCYFLIRGLIKYYNSLDSDSRREFLDGFSQGLSKSRNKSNFDVDDNRNYVIQYRDQVRSSWIDGPGSNDESVAESMFDRFLQNDPRAERRCRLVKKRNGRVISVLSTN